MPKRLWSVVALCVAAGGVGFGVLHGHHVNPSATSNSHPAWLQNAVAASNSMGSTTIDTGNSASGITATTNPRGNETASFSGSSGTEKTTAPTQTSPAKTSTSTKMAASSAVSSGGTKSTQGTTNQTGSSANTSNHSTQGLPPAPDLGSFTVIVSEDKGTTLLSQKQLQITAGESLMTYMHQNYQIETAYNDDFMIAINGIKSQWTGVPASQRQPVDWFLYINDETAPAGAGYIIPKAGDVDRWDYHRWDPSTGQ